MEPCERYLKAINELADGTLGPIRRAELELHLETCDGCRTLAEDLLRIAQTARSLETIEAPDAVWDRLATRLHEDGLVTKPRSAFARRTYAALALAAALVVAVAASAWFLTRSGREEPELQAVAERTPPAAPAAPLPVDPLAAVASELDLTEKHFQSALERADQIVDPETRAVLQKNWLVMTDALAESRKALEADPQNLPARQSFYETLRQKIQFLQDTIALMNEMRQGNADGAAQIVEGGKS